MLPFDSRQIVWDIQWLHALAVATILVLAFIWMSRVSDGVKSVISVLCFPSGGVQVWFEAGAPLLNEVCGDLDPSWRLLGPREIPQENDSRIRILSIQTVAVDLPIFLHVYERGAGDGFHNHDFSSLPRCGIWKEGDVKLTGQVIHVPTAGGLFTNGLP